MRKNKAGALVPFHDGKILLEKVPQLAKIAQIFVTEITNIDSTNMDYHVWTKLANVIADNYSLYDGFVITHGTDTMAYSASALTFALGKIGKPVIFTGSQKPVDDVPTDAVNNLLNAVIIAKGDIVGVYIAFGSKILIGSRATKMSESSLDAFDSPMVTPIGEISLEPKINGLYRKGKKAGEGISLRAGFKPGVVSVILTPGLEVDFLEKLTDNATGIILSAFGPGNIPDKLLPFLKKAKERSVPVVIISQCRKGITQMQLYEVGANALKYGAIAGNDMTIEAVATKLMWILAQTHNLTEIRQAFAKNYFGEVTV